MLRRKDWMEIEEMARKGMYLKDIAAELGVHPRTVRRALRRGGPPAGKRPRARGSKLDRFKPRIDELVREGVWNGVVILRELEAVGYTGKVTLIRDYLGPKRPLRPTRVTVRFETEPGVQMQADWGKVRTRVAGEERLVSFSVSTLGFSRRFHFWAAEREDAEHTYEGVIRAFEHFGGATEEVLVDNQKSAVIAHRVGERVQFHERFVDLAAHYGFRPRACRPYRARTKGKDERMVGYVKHHFFVRYRAFESLEHLNALAQAWLAEEADRRVHGTVHEVVAERFERERPHLRPLPSVRYDTSYREARFAAWDGYVDVLGNRYSVPDDYRGRPVEVRIRLDGSLEIYSEAERIAEHRIRSSHEGWVTVPSHHGKLWAETMRVERRDLSVYEEVSSWSS